MSVEVLTAVWKFAPYSENTLLTLLALADWSNDDGESWPSVETLAKKSRQSERNCRYTLRKMEKDGYISTWKRLDNSSVYSINLARLRGAIFAPVGGQFGAENVSPIAPYTSLDTSVKPSSPSEKGDGKHPSKKPSADPRYTEFVEILSKGYQGRKWQFGFGAADGNQLKELLRLRPRWTSKDFIGALKFYFESEGVVPGALPRTYLVRLPNYHAGPLNKFGKLVESDKACAATENMR